MATFWSFRPDAARCRRADAFFKPSHAIISEHRFPNIVPEHDFPGISRGAGLNFSRSQFQGFRNMAANLGHDAPEDSRMVTPKSHPEIAGQNGETKFNENGGFLGHYHHWHVALRS